MIYDDMIKEQPGLWCLTMGHLSTPMVNSQGVVYGSWCPWCGAAAYDVDQHEGDA